MDNYFNFVKEYHLDVLFQFYNHRIKIPVCIICIISVVFCFRSIAQIIALTIAVLFILSFIAINFFISKVQVR